MIQNKPLSLIAASPWRMLNGNIPTFLFTQTLQVLLGAVKMPIAIFAHLRNALIE
jgi:hypothetical protein